MKTLDEIKSDIKRRMKIEYEVGIQRSISELIKGKYGDQNYVCFTVMKNDNAFNKEISEVVLNEVSDAGFRVEVDDDTEIFTRYKIFVDL